MHSSFPVILKQSVKSADEVHGMTVNEEDNINYIMIGNSDAIITDSVKLSG